MQPVIIIGSGGHARVLLEILRMQKRRVLGFIDNDSSKKAVNGLPILGDDYSITAYEPGSVKLVNGIGSVGDNSLRKKIYSYYKSLGYEFLSVIHPTAFVSESAVLAEGVQLMAGCIVQTDSKIGCNTLVNTKASIDHDCIIGSHVHIAPGCTLSGNVTVSDDVHLGTAAAVIQNIFIARHCLIGAGAVVAADITEENIKVVGVPAKRGRE